MESSSDDNTASDVSQRLLPHHLEHLQESGLSDDTIKRAAIYSVDSPWVATQLGFPHLTKNLPTIALAGVWSWLTKQGEESQPLHDLDEINLKEREVFLVFDSDIVEKPEVQWAEYHFAQELESRGARVSAICLPEGKGGTKVGLDDYLVNYSIEEFHKLPKVTIKKPTPLPDATQPIIRILP